MTRVLAQDDPLATRQRLLDAAGEVFASVGYRDATVREICSRAGANLAAVNYHFRDKERLYAAVLAAAYESAEQRYPMGLAGQGQAPEDMLRGFVRVMMLRMFDDGKPAWHGRLMAREMMEPTAALDGLVEQVIRPKSDALRGMVRLLMTQAASAAAGRAGTVDESVVADCARSIIGQMLFYHQNRPVLERLFPDLRMDGEGVERLARHIAEFSLAGVAAAAQRAGCTEAHP